MMQKTRKSCLLWDLEYGNVPFRRGQKRWRRTVLFLGCSILNLRFEGEAGSFFIHPTSSFSNQY